MPRALISGVTGQDGSYLAELLLEKGYEVYALVPHRHAPHFDNIRSILDHKCFHILPGDMTDASSLVRAVQTAQPDEVYNLAAQSFVKRSWDIPVLTFATNTLGLVSLLEACRYHAHPDVRIYQASSSEIFGNAPAPQHEGSSWSPRSPYAVSKAAAHMMATNYRESYGMHISCGIMFNHESERRGDHFVTQKVCKAAVEIRLGIRDKLVVGDLTPKRDWGYAPDYVEVMWRMLQQEQPDDFVIGTGESHSVQELIDVAFDLLGISTDLVRQSEEFMRPCDIPELRSSPDKAFDVLKWEPKVRFEELVRRMVDRWTRELLISQGDSTPTSKTTVAPTMSER